MRNVTYWWKSAHILLPRKQNLHFYDPIISILKQYPKKYEYFTNQRLGKSLTV